MKQQKGKKLSANDSIWPWRTERLKKKRKEETYDFERFDTFLPRLRLRSLHRNYTAHDTRDLNTTVAKTTKRRNSMGELSDTAWFNQSNESLQLERTRERVAAAAE